MSDTEDSVPMEVEYKEGDFQETSEDDLDTKTPENSTDGENDQGQTEDGSEESAKTTGKGSVSKKRNIEEDRSNAAVSTNTLYNLISDLQITKEYNDYSQEAQETVGW